IDLCFFFQAEDGIRDWSVTGVQTCALPIYLADALHLDTIIVGLDVTDRPTAVTHPKIQWVIGDATAEETLARVASIAGGRTGLRSEERRVGKECRSRRGPKRKKKRTAATDE